ncbi:MAG: ribonuclease E/G [Paracoccaceae bacterium]
MSKKMLIDATHAEETRVVVVDGNKIEEFDFETLNKRQLAGNIYLAKVTRVEPSLQAAFVDYGGNRHGFLAFAEIHPDYYQIPVADRQALLEEERAFARAEDDEDNNRSRRRSPKPRGKPQAESNGETDPVVTGPSSMDVVDLEDAADSGDVASADHADNHDHAHDNDSHADSEPNGESEAPYRAMDTASETDDEIESIAEEDVQEEISQPRRNSRARRYKIQEVVKVRQIMLVQVVKEERGNKGAALTTYLSLAGRYCVLMPNTARGGGISRKITQAVDRKKLKEIAGEMEVPEGAGLIIRTAGAKRTKSEIKRDYEYLMRMWEQVRELTLKSIAPAAIYEEGDLIKRSIRDLYSREIEEVLVEGEGGYRTAKDFMRMIMPSHAKQVQRYQDATPLFARYQVEGYLAGMFNPTVQLKSGGYIVIGVTEALVAIDVNSGRATKEGSIEDTATKTNLEAAEEISRQLRLRDLAGLIVIDFIDMEERRNNLAVEKRLKDKLKTDRARIQIGRISGFGLLEMSRQRLRPGMLESTTQPCSHCHGTGLIRSDDNMALQVLRALEEEGTRKRSKEVLLRAPIGIINYLINHKREHIALIEARYGMAVRIEADPMMISPDYTLEKFKTATRVVPEPASVISGHAGLMGAPAEDEDEYVDDLVEDEDDESEAEAADDSSPDIARNGNGDGNGDGKKKRRRRRRRRGGAREGGEDGAGPDDGGDEAADDAEPAAVSEEAAEGGSSKSRSSRSRSRSRKPKSGTPVEAAEAAGVVEVTVEAVEPVAEVAAKPPAKSRSRTSTAKAKSAEVAAEVAADVVAEPVVDEVAEAPKKRTRAPRKKAGDEPSAVVAVEKPKAKSTKAAAAKPAVKAVAEPEPQMPELVVAFDDAPAAAGTTLRPDPGVDDTKDDPAKPRRKGWWSLKK